MTAKTAPAADREAALWAVCSSCHRLRRLAVDGDLNGEDGGCGSIVLSLARYLEAARPQLMDRSVGEPRLPVAGAQGSLLASHSLASGGPPASPANCPKPWRRHHAAIDVIDVLDSRFVPLDHRPQFRH